MKLLLVTYSCAPNAGSEDGVGWHMLRTLSLHHEVVVVTRGTFNDKIDSEELRRQGHNVRFVFVSNPVSRQSFINRKLFQPIYYLWQLRAALKVREITKKERFDVIQHVNWVRCWMPSAILGAASGKLVWGPVGGIESIPENFLRGWEYGRVRETLKRFLAAGSRFDPFVRKLAHKSSLGLATTRESQHYMIEMGCPTKLLSECALSSAEVDYLSQQNTSDQSCFRFISMGRLLGWKGFQYGIRAFFQANIPSSEYWVVGDGPGETRMKRLVADLGMQDRVRFWGRVERQQALDLLSQCHVTVHPSFRDSGGWVCLEAMAAKKPVICLALAGPGVNVTGDTGTVVPAVSPQQVVDDIAAAMQKYASDHELVTKQGEAGLQRVRDAYTWEKRYEVLLQHYQSLLRYPTGEGHSLPTCELPSRATISPESVSS